MKNTTEILFQTPAEVQEDPNDLRMKLRSLVHHLPGFNSYFINHLLDFEKERENYWSQKEWTNIFSEILNFADNITDVARTKIDERQSAERVDLMTVLEPFNYVEKRTIAKNLAGIQLTDGCTVGCAWCGFEAKKKVEKSITYDSFKKFMETFGRFLPSVPLYYDSDPFDWVSEDGVYDYTDLAEVFLNNTKRIGLYTSTAVPEGSELSVVRFISFYYSRVMDNASRGEGARLQLRFSQTEENDGRIETIKKILKAMKIPEKFLEDIIIWVDRRGDKEELEVDNHAIDPVKKIGYYVKHPERDETGRDIFGISCIDGLHIAPNYEKKLRGRSIDQGGVRSESMEIVTRRNPRGERTEILQPGILRIPKLTFNEGYSWPLGSMKAKGLFELLPKHTYHVFRDGAYQGTEVVESVRRDALAFGYAFINLETLSDIFLDDEAREYFQKSPKQARLILKDLRRRFIPQFEERRKSCLALFDDEADEEAKRIAHDQIGKIQTWLNNIDAKLGLKDLSL